MVGVLAVACFRAMETANVAGVDTDRGIGKARASALLRLLTLAEAIERPAGGSFERTHVVFDHHLHAARIDSVVFVAQEVSQRT